MSYNDKDWEGEKIAYYSVGHERRLLTRSGDTLYFYAEANSRDGWYWHAVKKIVMTTEDAIAVAFMVPLVYDAGQRAKATEIREALNIK